MPPPAHKLDLLRASLTDRTFSEYRNNLLQFIEFCVDFDLEIGDAETLDSALCDYAHFVFEQTHRDGRQHVNKVVSAVKLLFPAMSKSLFMTHRALSGWAKLRPGQHMTPIPHDLALGIAYFLRRRGEPEMALATLLSFDCHLRVNEALRLTKSCVFMEESPSLKVHLVIERHKTGANSSVHIRNKLARTLLVRHLEHLAPRRQKLFQFNEDAYRGAIHAIIKEELPLLDPRFVITPHGLRRGGATRDYQLKRLTIAQIKDRGRWKRDETIYNYVLPAHSLAVQQKYAEKTRRILKRLNSEAGAFFNVPEVRTGWEEPCCE